MLSLYIGPMFSGKSTELVRTSYKYSVLGVKVVQLSHISDARYNSDDCIVTHDGEEIRRGTYKTDSLTGWRERFPEVYKSAQLILIDESQFFSDLMDFVVPAVDRDNKTVYVAGLDGDYNRKPIGDTLKLIPYADKVIKFNSLCPLCGGVTGVPAPFSHRKNRDKDSKIEVGGAKEYVSLCRKHYLEAKRRS